MLGKHFAAVTVVGMVLLGCSESQNPIAQYGNEVLGAHERTQRVRARADMQAITTGIQEYYVEQGRYPVSLTDLSLVQNQGIDPDLYVYDPATGNIQLR